jgi:hypothetical protein
MSKVLGAAAIAHPGWRSRSPCAQKPKSNTIQADGNRKGRRRPSDVPEPDIVVDSCSGENRQEKDETKISRH